MRAHRRDIETPEGREASLTRLANAAFHGNQSMIMSLLDRPSRSNGTGNLSLREFAKQGITEFRTVEQKLLHSPIANIPLKGFLEDYKRFMPDILSEYACFMINECHKGRYDAVLNMNKLETADERVQTLRALYQAHGVDGIDTASEHITFDHETRKHEFFSRPNSPGIHINRPDEAALSSYVGFMNAVCDLFLDPAKQKAEDMAAWQACLSGGDPQDTPWGCAAE
jgi:hypothetical protein